MIKPYLGGEELSNNPRQLHDRYVINFSDLPLCRLDELVIWETGDREQRRVWGQSRSFQSDYPDAVAADWPALLEIVRRNVKPIRDGLKRDTYRERLWRFGEAQTSLYENIKQLIFERVLVVAQVSPQHAVAFPSQCALELTERHRREAPGFVALAGCWIGEGGSPG